MEWANSVQMERKLTKVWLRGAKSRATVTLSGCCPFFPSQEMPDSTAKIFTVLFSYFYDRRHGDDAVVAF